jgi:phage recombination protein Bet
MNTLAKREANSPIVTSEQTDLVRRTVAAQATPEELALYLYDCQRQRVHPLDKLLHFTKRGGKYVPVTSIDLMRARAAETGEYCGNSDAEIIESDKKNPMKKDEMLPYSASVTVLRLVQGAPCAFSATARYSEYKPEKAPMWAKMPTVMLSKCAEALALRKAFPQQLGGLYAAEELDQAPIDLPRPVVAPSPPTAVRVTAPAPPDKDEFTFEANEGVTDPMSEGPLEPVEKVEVAPVATPTEWNHENNRPCSPKQIKRLFAILRDSGKDRDDVEAYVQSLGFKDIDAMTDNRDKAVSAYDHVCTWIETL